MTIFKIINVKTISSFFEIFNKFLIRTQMQAHKKKIVSYNYHKLTK